MTRSELVAALVEQYPELSSDMVDTILTTLFDEIMDSVAKGHRIELRNFGIFAPRFLSERKTVNPSTGAPLVVAPQVVPSFKPGKRLKEKINLSK